jgi:hypothetical protein
LADASLASGIVNLGDVGDIIHPGQTCFGHLVSFFTAGIKRAIAMYGPFFAIPIVIFRLPELIKNPAGVLIPYMTNVLRSSVFLGAYCAFAWTSADITRNLGFKGDVVGLMAGVAGGSAAWFEKKPRRIELALYISTFAVQSTYMLNVAPYVPAVPHWEALLMGVATSVMMQARFHEPSLVRRSYLSALRIMLGNTGVADDSERAKANRLPRVNTKSTLLEFTAYGTDLAASAV